MADPNLDFTADLQRRLKQLVVGLVDSTFERIFCGDHAEIYGPILHCPEDLFYAIARLSTDGFTKEEIGRFFAVRAVFSLKRDANILVGQRRPTQRTTLLSNV